MMLSQEFLQAPWVILILIGNYLLMLTIFFVQRHVGKKNHRYDERYYIVNNRAKGRTWDIMLVIMLIAWPIVIIFDGISFAFYLLTILYMLHCLIFGIAASFYQSKE
jgi:membrane protein required for beta-lactamase induction